MKDDASLFAAIDLGSNAFRLMIGQSVRSRKGLADSGSENPARTGAPCRRL